MLRRLASGLIFSAILGSSAGAQAFGGWMAGAPGFVPVEQRVAVAVTPLRTTLWTSLRFASGGGAVGIVLPVPAGAAVDVSSDAWFEALEVATAPRVFPWPEASPTCPGVAPATSTPYDIVGHVEHTVSADLTESALLPDASSVQTWAQARGLTLSTALQAGLGGFTGARFLAMRFATAAGPGQTPTVRIAVPGAVPTLPLSLTEARGGNLLVTTWLLGAGIGQVEGSTPQLVETSILSWDADNQKSNYAAERLLTFTSGADSILEAAGHDGLAADTPIQGGASIDGLLRTYFDRATGYDGAPVDPATCLPPAAATFSSTEAVAPSCPRAELIAPPSPCVETLVAGTVNPAVLRCGADADNLAVALSGGSPGTTWLTRQSLVIQAGDHGFDWHLLYAGATPLLPVRTTGYVDTSGCPAPPPSMGWGGSGSSGAASSSSGSPSWGSSGGDLSGDANVDLSGLADALDSTDTSCDGTSVDAGSGCSGDSGSGCSGGDGGGSCDAGDVGGGCSGADFGGGSFDCSVNRRRGPRLSPLLLLAMAILAPLRRRGTVARRRK